MAPLGASSGDGSYFPIDHDEYVQIPGDALRGQGRKLRNPHYGRAERGCRTSTRSGSSRSIIRPARRSSPTRSCKAPPFPDFRFYGVSNRIYPSRARGPSYDHDVLGKLLAKDRTYPDDFRRKENGSRRASHADARFRTGSARTIAPFCILNGWVDWADGSTFLAAAQESKDGLISPYLQVKDDKGQWKTVIEDMGMPAGKPKTIAVDLTGNFLSASREVRIVTNLCVYWDEIFLGESSALPPSTTAPDPDGSGRGCGSAASPQTRDRP